MNIRWNDAIKLFISILICELTGVIGSFFTVSRIPTWYAQLAKPKFNPPSWVFGPVWGVLYGLMGCSAFIVWNRDRRRIEVKIALLFFAAQLLANGLWSFLFFGMRDPSLAFIDIVVLWILIVCTIFAFFRVSRYAAYLLLPYLAWVSFAAYLNYMISILQ